MGMLALSLGWHDALAGHGIALIKVRWPGRPGSWYPKSSTFASRQALK